MPKFAISGTGPDDPLAFWTPVNEGAGGASAWGDITGTLSNQTDLQTALDGKSGTGHSHSGLMPSGGSTGQVLKKASATDFDATWQADATGGGGGEAFPVGSVFLAVVSTNPATLLGYGTWSAFAAGRMLVGIDAGDPDFDTAEEVGGAKTHTLTVAEMPSHTHVQDAHNHTQQAHNHTQNSFAPRIVNSGTAGTVGVQGASTASNANASNSATTATNQAATAVNNAATAVNQNTGGGGAHNNMPPYIAVFMWKRTA